MASLETRALELYQSRLLSRPPLSGAAQDALARLPARLHHKRAGTSFVSPGDNVTGAWIIASGLVSGFHQLKSGARQFVALHMPGDMADLASLQLGVAASGLEALTSAALVHIPNAALQTIRANHPDLADAMAFDAAVDMAVQMQWSTNVGRKCSRARLAHFLCEMAARCARTSVRMGSSFELPLTRFHLADALAITPVHVNRTLMALRAERVVEIRNRTVHVLDWPALTRLGEFDPFYLVNRTPEIARTHDDWPCRRRA